MIVIGILLAIGGLVLVNVLGASEKADIKLTRAQINAFESALEMFKAEMKRWPTEDEGLSVLWSKANLEDEADEAKWGGPYLKEAKSRDTWGNEWRYVQPSELVEGQAYDIISFGPDGEEDTDDDITNQDDRTDEEGELLEGFDDFDMGQETGG